MNRASNSLRIPFSAMLDLTGQHERLAQMKQQARRYMESRSLEAAYLQLWDSYQHG